ncbi:hypothetical protein [Kribbella swartbergensis]
MRATYEDLLRTARRMAVNAHRGIRADEASLMADWEAVLAATVVHLRWLRGRLTTHSPMGAPVRVSDTSLGRLAQALGAGADLIATQTPNTASVLNDHEALAAARAEVAAIALIGERAVLRDIRTRTPGHHHLLTVMAELESLAQADVRRRGLGALGALTTGGPPAPVDGLSTLVHHSARWERAHASVPPLTLLTRDLRSTTAQLRTVCRHVWRFADHLLAAPQAELDARQRLDLMTLKAGLRAFEAGAVRAAECWRRRLSDLRGQSSSPGEVAFLDLRAALDQVVRSDGRLLSPAELVPNGRAAAALLDAMDELLWSADQVARNQKHAVAGLILEGRLFVPRREVARANLTYLRRPSGGSRPLQARWVRTNLANCFDELTDGMTWSVDHLAVAADVARRLAGTSHQSRPAGEERMRAPAPYLDVPNKPRRTKPYGTGIANPGPEPAELER